MRRYLFMLALIVAGELVFGLAFNVPRFFRPTMLQAFDLTNTQLGDMFAVYGAAAMLAYFPGGALADHFSARALMTFSLFATALGGLYMATFPGSVQMAFLYGYWGITTVFLFWGALIRATREWGGDAQQGVAFGVLEGGRGLVAASVATFCITVFSLYMPDNARLATVEEREAGFRTVILLYTLFTFSAGVLVWFAIPAAKNVGHRTLSPIKGMREVLRRPIVWAQAAIIVCAYCGYKGLDNYSLYAEQVLGMHEVDAERLASYGAWTRPVAAALAGWIADRYNATRSIAAVFAILSISFGTWSLVAPSGAAVGIIYLNFFTTYIAVYALRGIYFALLQENRTPKYLTGAAVGIISLVGYTPDIFFAPIGGRILDANPGLIGFQNYFMFLAAIAATGIVAVVWLVWLRRHGGASLWQAVDADRD